jgi:hypothetical protein
MIQDHASTNLFFLKEIISIFLESALGNVYIATGMPITQCRLQEITPKHISIIATSKTKQEDGTKE